MQTSQTGGFSPPPSEWLAAPPQPWLNYLPPSQVYDEVMLEPGHWHPHCQFLFQALASLTPHDFEKHRAEIKHLLQQHGVTFNIYNDPQGIDRLWSLDSLPHLLPNTTWQVLERGLAQRAELFDLLLKDFYGSQQLLRKGLLPPEIIYTHPGFLRPCQETLSTKTRALTLYAADLARDPKGQFWIIGDRTQNPAGFGYALENRNVLSRVLSGLYREAQASRLTAFFRIMRETLHSLAKNSEEDPLIVVLSPGAGNEAYFEHAYLANYLGYLLVEGSDLVVKDQRVWFKSLDGWQPVDVICRRVDDSFCDPLELRSDSLLGVPGLLQAVRAGNVAVANPLGTGVLKNSGLMAFLPQLCQYLLGENLLLPSVRTWWCGQPSGLRYVLEHLEHLVIKPLGATGRTTQIFGSQLTREQLHEWRQRLQAKPHFFVGQEELKPSTVPLFVDNRLQSRHMVLRCFLVARPEDYVVMPGGLTRVGSRFDDIYISNQHGGISKDTWVLASEAERATDLNAPALQATPIVRKAGNISGRVADNFFWVGRYAQRTESAVRLIREFLIRQLDTEQVWPPGMFAEFLRAITHQTATYPGFVGEGFLEKLQAPAAELQEVILSSSRTGSIRYNIKSITQAARAVRDHFSDDIWRVINSLPEETERLTTPEDLLHYLEKLVLHFAALRGLCVEKRQYGVGWRFWDMGRSLERAMNTLILLRNTLQTSPLLVNGFWQILLNIEDSFLAYGHRSHLEWQAITLTELFLQDESNPSSVISQILSLLEHFNHLPHLEAPPHRSTEERFLMEALTRLRLFEVQPLEKDATVIYNINDLQQIFHDVYLLLGKASEGLSKSYFNRADFPRSMGDDW